MPPGEVLVEEFLKPLDLSVEDLATALRLDPRALQAIAAGTSPLTADVALRLGRRFGTSPEFWLWPQNRYDLERIAPEIENTLAQIPGPG